MSKITPGTIDHIAKLANLPLTGKEKSAYSSQLGKIVGYMDQLAKVSTADVEPTFVPADLKNITRPDEVGECLTQKEALKNAPRVKKGLFMA